MLRKLSLMVALLSSSAAHAEWQVASSDHFVVYSNDAPDKVKAQTVRLETFDRALKMLRQVPDVKRGPAARVTVYVVDDMGDIQRLYPGGKGRDIGGFYSTRATGPVAFVPRRMAGSGASSTDAQTILLHEYSHHFMYSDWPTGIFPKWFSEGFAEFNSTARFEPDGSVVFGAPPIDRARGVTMVNQMPMQHLLRPDPGKLDGLQTYALYSRGWLLTHYLTFEPERRRQLADYVQAINDGKPAEQAAAVFGNLNTLDAKLTSYVKRPKFQSIRIPASDLKIGPVTVRALTPGEAATMPARLESEATVDAKEAPVVAALARQLAAPFPNDAAAQNVLAEAEFDAGNYPAAEAAAARAFAADPTSVHAALYRGMALQAVAEKAKSTDAAQWAAVRKWYTTANRIDPENPQPLILYYRSFAAAKAPPTKNASAGLLYAAALAPYDTDVRLEATRIYLQQGKPLDARKQLLPVAYSPHISGAPADKLRSVVAALDKNDTTAALSLLDAAFAASKKDEGKAAPAGG